jgi:molybdenum-dependent DNA-binding transcriptional regulator ModE
MKVQSEDLRTFAAVVDSGSITAAAEQLGLTASAVSRSLAKLEEKLGTTLLNRTTRRMQLTEEGTLFLDGARHILGQMDDLEERLALRRQKPSGRLRINAASPLMLHAVVPHIDAFRQRYPDIELQLNSNDLNIDLLEQSTDIAIRIGGQGQELGESIRSLLFAFGLAIFLVYLVMASQFESLLHPFVIQFTIPLALVGAVAALLLTGSPASVVVFIGLILLVGLVVKNAIILIDKVNQLREDGMTKREALVEGARSRLRPIMMTTLFGLLISTLVTLSFTPCLLRLLRRDGPQTVHPA